MNRIFTAIDLSRLPPPQVVATIAIQDIFDEMMVHLQQLDPEFNALTPADPAYKVILVAAYREAILRQQMNDKAMARMLAFAVDGDLDHIGASMAVPVARLAGETNDAYRARLVLAPEAYSVAGPIGAYKFFALSAHSEIKGVSVWNPGIGGRVNIAVLSKTGNGACFGVRINYPAGYADGAVSLSVTDVQAPLSNGQQLTFEGGAVFTLNAAFAAGVTVITGQLVGSLVDGERAGILPFVQDALDPETRLPLCDTPEVMSAEIIEYQVVAELTLYSGPDATLICNQAISNVLAYVSALHKCGNDITRSNLNAELRIKGAVQDVNLISPAASIKAGPGQAAYCTAVNVIVVGRDE